MKKIKPQIIFFVITLFFLKSSFAQTTFQKVIPLGFNLTTNGIKGGMPFGTGYLIVGSSLMFIDSLQVPVWKNVGNMGISSIKKLSNNNLIAIGISQTNTNVKLFKINSLGDTVWTKTFVDTVLNRTSIPINIDVTPSGNFMFGGLLEDVIDKAFFIKTDSNANIIWNKIINVGSDIFLTSTKLTADGGIIAAGSVDGQTSNTVAIKLDSNGTVEWTMKYFGVFNAKDIIETTDGGFAFVATSFQNSFVTADVMLVKTDRFGVVEYAKTYGSAFGDEGETIQQLPNNDFIISGRKQDTLGGGGSCFSIGPCYDFYLIKTTSLGDTIFTRMYGDNGFDVPASLDVNVDGGFTMIGQFQNDFGFNTGTYIVKTDSLGLTGNCNFTYTNTNTRVGNVNLTFIPISVTIDSGFTTTHQPIIYTRQNIVGANTVTICSSATVGINDIEQEKNEVQIFPNPGNEQLTIETDLTQGEFEMYDLVGRLVLTHTIKSNIETINTAHLPKGTYIYRISTAIGFPSVGKWMKN